MSSTSESHKRDAPATLRFGIAVVSTSRSEMINRGSSVSDVSGDLIVKFLVEAGHRVVDRSIIPDEPERIRDWFKSCIRDPEIDVLVTSGGTGISKSDVTIETVRGSLDKELSGFGEIFRMLSYEDMGSAAFITRALAGTIGEKAIFCIPGSPSAVELALTKLILPEAGHIIRHIRE